MVKNIRNDVYEFEFSHNKKFTKHHYNKWFKFTTETFNNKKILVNPYYKILLKCNASTFEYGGITTSVILIPVYKDPDGNKFTKVYMSTIDDSCLNLWLPVQDKIIINKFLKFFQKIKKLHSCVETYNLITDNFKELNLPNTNIGYNMFYSLLPKGVDVDFN